MMILGKKDTAISYKDLISQIKNTDVELVEFPDGHMSHIENKDEFLRTIVYFIEK